MEQAATASGENKRIYEAKAGQHVRGVTQWLRERMTTAFEVTCEGRTRSLHELIQGQLAGGAGRASVGDLINVAGAVCLAPQFQNQSPDYPTFSVLVTRQSREQAAGEALKWMAGGVKSRQGAAVLDALRLLDGDQLRPRRSGYAKQVLDLLESKRRGQVLNRGELVQDDGGIEYWTPFRLEPEFLAVVLAALVHAGAVVLSLTGRKLGAGAADQLARIAVRDLAAFKHVERPKGLPLEPLRQLFALLGLPEGKLVNEGTRDGAVQDLQVEVAARVERLAKAQARLQEGFIFWDRPILPEQQHIQWTVELREAKDFMESLQAFNTAGKLNNFPHDAAAVAAHAPGLDLVGEVDELTDLVAHAGPMITYLSTAEAVLPGDHPWREEVAQAKVDLFARVTNPDQRAAEGFRRELLQILDRLKTRYQDAYLALHASAHLGAGDDEKKATLVRDSRLRQLQKLDAVEIMPHQQLKSFQDTLFGLKTCFALSRQDIDAGPVCPHTPYRPVESPPGSQSAAQTLAGLNGRLDELVSDWTQTLLGNLEDPTVRGNVELLSDPVGKDELAAFIQRRELPDPVSPAFVQALQEALTGLEKVTVTGSDLRETLVRGGIPCTVEDLRSRFVSYVEELTKGKDPNRIRVVIE